MAIRRDRWGWGFTQGFGTPVSWVTPTDIPASEAAELKNLYDLTAGDSWTDNTNWGTTETANDWFGITVVGGKVNKIELGTNNLVGNVASFDPSVFTTSIYLYLFSNAGVVGDLSSWSFPATLQRLLLYSCGVSGSISGWGIHSAWTFLWVYNTSLSGTPDMSAAVAFYEVRYQNNALAEANVDAVLLELYTRWATGSLTNATPALNISGTNAAPSGTYQDGDPPTTGLEYVYEIANDPEATGYNTWTVTYTGGIAP